MVSTSFPTLKTERLLLRKIQQDDIQNIYNGLSNTEVIRYYGISFDTLEATEEQMIWFKNLEETETGIWWAIAVSMRKYFMVPADLTD